MVEEEEEEVHREVMELRDEEKEQRTQLAEELKSFILGKEHSWKTFNVNADLGSKQKEVIKALVWGHANSFTWKPVDMLGIDPHIIYHKLNVYPWYKASEVEEENVRSREKRSNKVKSRKAGRG